MPLVKRLVKGSALTYAEADGNLTYLDNKVTGSAGLLPVFDSNNTVTGSSVLGLTGSSVTVNGSLTVTGDLTAMQYIISSSVTHFTESFSSGSTVFGDTLNDTHQFTGSVFITGSATANAFIGDGSGLTNLTTFSRIATGSVTASVDVNNSTIFSITSASVNFASINKTIRSTSFGSNALSASSGTNNVAFGDSALQANTNGANNVAVGYIALASNFVGARNVAVGNAALLSNTSDNNTAVGYSAGRSNITGSGSVFLGYNAGYNETQSNKLYIANSNTSTPLIKGDFNTGLLQLNTAAGTQITGSLSVNGFLSSSDGAYFSNAITVTHMTIGHGPTENNTNIAIGWETMPVLGSGLRNTIVGASSAQLLQSGSDNTVFGNGALASLISGSSNTAIGQNAGFFASGSGNVFIGHQAGQLQTSGDNKLWIANSNTLTPLIKGDFSSGLLQFYTTGSTQVTGSLLVTGSSVFSGSATGIVNSLSISSNTASLDLNRGNFFTLQLVEGTDTYINPSNITPGQTVNILLSTTGSGTVSFPNTVLQASGSAYVPTTTTGKDIITLVSYDSTNLYLANVKNFI